MMGPILTCPSPLCIAVTVTSMVMVMVMVRVMVCGRLDWLLPTFVMAWLPLLSGWARGGRRALRGSRMKRCERIRDRKSRLPAFTQHPASMVMRNVCYHPPAHPSTSRHLRQKRLVNVRWGKPVAFFSPCWAE